MCGVVYANCRAAMRQQSRRCSADASSTARYERYLVAPRNHISSVSIFVPPAHSSSKLHLIRSGGATSSIPALVGQTTESDARLPVLATTRAYFAADFFLASNARSSLGGACVRYGSRTWSGAIGEAHGRLSYHYIAGGGSKRLCAKYYALRERETG